MTTQKAIERAIEGGWQALGDMGGIEIYPTGIWWGDQIAKPIEGILLNPSFWKALGKTEGWDGKHHTVFGPAPAEKEVDSWLYHMLSLIFALAEASEKPDFDMHKTITDFFAML